MYEILEKFVLIVYKIAHQTLKMLLHYLVKSKKNVFNTHTHTHARTHV